MNVVRNKLLISNIFPVIFIVFTNIRCGHTEVFHAFLNRTVYNNGFHRNIEYKINIIRPQDINYCKWTVLENIPSGMYVDPDEILDLQRSNVTPHKMKVDGVVNVEAAQQFSSPHSLWIFLDDSLSKSNGVIVKFPLHLRYHKAVSGGGYATLKLRTPLLLAKCTEYLTDTEVTRGPCNHLNNQECIWNIIPFIQKGEDIVIEVPVGNLDHRSFVAVFTILSVIIGCSVIISPLIKNRI